MRLSSFFQTKSAASLDTSAAEVTPLAAAAVDLSGPGIRAVDGLHAVAPSTALLNQDISSAARGRSTDWKSLLKGTPDVPLCTGHRQPALLFTTGKKGVNQGRKFYCCALPANLRCKFFCWLSDLKSIKSS